MTQAPTQPQKARVSALPRDVAMQLAETEYQRLAEHVLALSPEHWSAQTSCPDWDVHAMACHVLGMAEYAASVTQRVRQSYAAWRQGGLFIDALTAHQVQRHVAESPAEVSRGLLAIGPRAARGRRRTPAFMRRLAIGQQPVDDTGSLTEPWTLGYLTDTILTRDTWMHRSDIAEATSTPMTLTAEHDGRIVADVAAEWAQRHRTASTLVLTGPAGGQWHFNGATDNDPGELIELDAVSFCRLLSGRGEATGLLAVRVPF